MTRRWRTTPAAWRAWTRSTPPSATGPPRAAWPRCWPPWTPPAVPAGRIYTVADIAADPHYRARGMLQEVTFPDGSRVTVPGVVPHLSRTPGGQHRLAPALGQDTAEVLRALQREATAPAPPPPELPD
jgi:hypothetical protein